MMTFCFTVCIVCSSVLCSELLMISASAPYRQEGGELELKRAEEAPYVKTFFLALDETCQSKKFAEIMKWLQVVNNTIVEHPNVLAICRNQVFPLYYAFLKNEKDLLTNFLEQEARAYGKLGDSMERRRFVLEKAFEQQNFDMAQCIIERNHNLVKGKRGTPFVLQLITNCTQYRLNRKCCCLRSNRGSGSMESTSQRLAELLITFRASFDDKSILSQVEAYRCCGAGCTYIRKKVLEASKFA